VPSFVNFHSLSKKIYSHGPAALVAIFEGKPSHWFDRDVWSDTNNIGLRELTTETSVETEGNVFGDDEHHDEQWFNPGLPGNSLVGYSVVGDLSKARAQYLVPAAKELAKKHGVFYIELGGSPWKIPQIRDKPLMREVDEPNPMIEKYKYLPEIKTVTP